LLTDAGFARQLAADPADALAGYELSAEDLDLLSAQVSFDRGALSNVEERISKAGMFGLLSSFTAGLGGLGGPTPCRPASAARTPRPAGLGGPDTVPGGGGGGDEFAIKEVDPAPAPSLDNPGARIVGFDPQPDPPGDPAVGPSGFVDPGARVGFDPQPDPPGDPANPPPGLLRAMPRTRRGLHPGEPRTSAGWSIRATGRLQPAARPTGRASGHHHRHQHRRPRTRHRAVASVVAGDAVSIKEVDPAPAPTLDNPGVRAGFNPQPDPTGSPLGGLHGEGHHHQRLRAEGSGTAPRDPCGANVCEDDPSPGRGS
jgi:hypothetical protein